MDGCGIYHIIFQIITPMLKTSIATVAIVTFLKYQTLCNEIDTLNYRYAAQKKLHYEESGEYISRTNVILNQQEI